LTTQTPFSPVTRFVSFLPRKRQNAAQPIRARSALRTNWLDIPGTAIGLPAGKPLSSTVDRAGWILETVGNYFFRHFGQSPIAARVWRDSFPVASGFAGAWEEKHYCRPDLTFSYKHVWLIKYGVQSPA
jgi:hypothetical protein